MGLYPLGIGLNELDPARYEGYTVKLHVHVTGNHGNLHWVIQV